MSDGSAVRPLFYPTVRSEMFRAHLPFFTTGLHRSGFRRELPTEKAANLSEPSSKQTDSKLYTLISSAQYYFSYEVKRRGFLRLQFTHRDNFVYNYFDAFRPKLFFVYSVPLKTLWFEDIIALPFCLPVSPISERRSTK